MSQVWPAPTPALEPCYRHPKAQAPVACTRCGRPICTDCMVSAPVGWQCRSCVKDAPPVRSMREVKAGGFALQDGRPYATFVIIGACVLAYVAQRGDPTIDGRFSLAAVDIAAGDWWRLVTSGFLHASPLHLGFNMLVLFQVGARLEARLGRARFLGVYAASLLGGAVGELILSSPTSRAVGASGAIFGLMGCLVVLSRRQGGSGLDQSIAGLLVVNLLVTFLIPGIAIGGHIGGLVVGALAGLAISVVPAPRQGGRGVVAATTAGLVATAGLLFVAAGPIADWAVRTGAYDIRLFR